MRVLWAPTADRGKWYPIAPVIAGLVGAGCRRLAFRGIRGLDLVLGPKRLVASELPASGVAIGATPWEPPPHTLPDDIAEALGHRPSS